MTDTPENIPETSPEAAPAETSPGGAASPVRKAYRDYLAHRLICRERWGRYGELTEEAERTDDLREADRFYDEKLAPAIREAGEAADALIDALQALRPEIQTVFTEAYDYRLGEATNDEDEDLNEHERERLRDIRVLADHLGMKV